MQIFADVLLAGLGGVVVALMAIGSVVQVVILAVSRALPRRDSEIPQAIVR